MIVVKDRKYCRYLFVLFLVQVPGIDLQQFDQSEGIVDPGNNLTVTENNNNNVKCYCDGDCEPIQGSDCLWGLTLDYCGCCLLCSRGEGEPCGGALGTCARGLKCSKKQEQHGSEATCAQPKDVENCENPISRDGCSFHGGECHCENNSMCPDTEMFLFDNEQECRSRISFLYTKNDDISSALTFNSQPTADDCHHVICPKVEDCPPDSYRLPSSVTRESDCCPVAQKCQCNPGQLCPKPECPPGWLEQLVLTSSGVPGNCCPLLKCSPNEGRKVCSYEGREYEPGESWTHDEDCTECSCSVDLVVSCQTIKCDLPADCGLARAPPNSCCPLCVGCVTSSGKVYNNSEVWEEDACTQCECDGGRVKCHAALCGAQCEHPVHVPGECCPRCGGLDDELFDEDDGVPKSAAVEGRKSLMKTSSSSSTRKKLEQQACVVLDEKLGKMIKWDGDEWNDGCRYCLCREGLEMCTLITCRPPYCEHPVFYPGDCCPRCPDEELTPVSSNVNVTLCPVERVHGDVWNLKPCLQCTCHHGLTLCSHPTCPPAPCDTSESRRFPEENSCCSQCPFPSSPEQQEGEEKPSLLQQEEGKGIDEEKIGADGPLSTRGVSPSSSFSSPTSTSSSSSPAPGRVNNKNSVTKSGSWKEMDGKRNCFSDDSHTEYSHGDTWKVGPCQSCVCRDGRIECFSSSGNCPRLTCDRPILAKNQCCPICLDASSSNGEKVKTEMNCTMSGSNETWTHGHSWTLDKCTHCICNVPLVQCTRTVCSISCKEPLLYLENECCPICPADDDTDTGPGENTQRVIYHGGPYCLVVIGALLVTSSALAYYVLRYHRRRRQGGEKAIITSCTSTSSSTTTNTNPTIDCCYFKEKKYEESSSIARSESCATQEKLIV